MKNYVAIGLALAVAHAQPLSAQDGGDYSTGPYLGLALSADFYDDDDDIDFDVGGSLGLQAGYRMNEHLRTEFELSASGAEIDDSDDNLFVGRATVSVYYDIQSRKNLFAPYVGAGLGIAGVNISDDDDDDDDLDGEFTWHGEAGVSLNFNTYFAIVPSYRYTWVDDSSGVTEESLTSHSAQVGLRVSF